MRPTTSILRLREGGRGSVVSDWIPADKELPGTSRCVLVTDLEGHFIACYEDDTWVVAYTGDPIDSHVTHWMELPEVPE
jgi:hypothetical protein